MKKSLTLLGIGAGLLVGLTSCQSSSSATGGYEEAMPMSELAIADGELPPWVFESGDTDQIPAGDSTARNNYAIPEPDESASVTSQKQPDHIAVAPATGTDDTVVEQDFTEPAKPLITHTEVTPTEPKPVVTHEPVVSHTSKPKPKPVASVTKPKQSSKPGAKKPKKVEQPTMVVYKVRPGDNLSDIAKRSGTTVAQIRKDSGIKGDIIHPGQTIKVRYTPKGYVAPKAGNAGKGGKGGASAPAPASKSTGYTVKAGDTISAIAKRNGVSTSALLAANGMKPADAAKLRAGRKLTIPGKPAAAKPAAKSAVKKSSGKKSTAKPKKK